MSASVDLFADEIAAARKEITAFALAGANDPNGPTATKLAAEQHFSLQELAQVEARVNAAAQGADQDKQAGYGVRYAWRIVGQFVERARSIDLWPFDVSPPGQGAMSINIKVRDIPIPPEAAALKSELFAALNVVRSIIDDRGTRLGAFGRAAKQAELLRLNETYMRDLQGIAEVGLMTSEPTHVSFARADLAQFKARFTLREAGKVKNDYVKTLLLWSSLAVLLFMSGYWITQAYAEPSALPGTWPRIMFDLRNFHLLAAGTAIGTWLSFSLRKQELAFEDLAVLEPDRLEPWVRVLYMVGLSTLVGLLLFSGAVVFGVGRVDGLIALHGHGSWALLVGMLAGVAERALGSAVSGRAAEFAGALGGGPKTKVNV